MQITVAIFRLFSKQLKILKTLDKFFVVKGALVLDRTSGSKLLPSS